MWFCGQHHLLPLKIANPHCSLTGRACRLPRASRCLAWCWTGGRTSFGYNGLPLPGMRFGCGGSRGGLARAQDCTYERCCRGSRADVGFGHLCPGSRPPLRCALLCRYVPNRVCNPSTKQECTTQNVKKCHKVPSNVCSTQGPNACRPHLKRVCGYASRYRTYAAEELSSYKRIPHLR